MAILNPTPPSRLVDGAGRPYFLWDVDMPLAEFEARLREPDPEDRAYWVGKLMRQAKPDDVFTFVDLQTIVELWPLVQRHLGRSHSLWLWLLRTWSVLP